LLFAFPHKLIFYWFLSPNSFRKTNQLPSPYIVSTMCPICVHRNFYESHAKCIILYKLQFFPIITGTLYSQSRRGRQHCRIIFLPLFAFTFWLPHRTNCVQRCTFREKNKIKHNDRHRDTIAGQLARVFSVCTNVGMCGLSWTASQWVYIHRYIYRE
jgi:hypothetical protein